jgi:hypothetical protein
MWADSIKMDLGAIEWSDVDGIYVTQNTDKLGAFVNAVMGLRVEKYRVDTQPVDSRIVK